MQDSLTHMHALMRGPVFFSFWGGGKKRKKIVFFLFPMCSHHVPMRFSQSPGCSPRCSQLCLRYIPYGVPKQIDDRQINMAHNVCLWRKVVCLFCFVRTYQIHQTKINHFGVLGLFGKLSTRRGAWAWFHSIWTCSVEVLEYWMISSMKIKLNCSWNFQRNWNVPLMLLERSWWAGFKGIYLVRFGFRMWEILIFKWFLQLKIETNSKKPGFGRKNQSGQRHRPH